MYTEVNGKMMNKSYEVEQNIFCSSFPNLIRPQH